MDLILDPKELRVLGCLIEKELATPEYYPLSLNALTNACNQKSNRQPVVDFDESEVSAVVDALADKGLVRKSVVGRVPKYEELFTRERKLVPREAALLCELLLRGAQTPGELRGRTARLYTFASLEEVLETLENLAEWGYLKQLPRMAGHKENRYVHLLCGEPDGSPDGSAETQSKGDDAPGGDSEPLSQRIAKIEQEVEALRKELEKLNAQFAHFRRQFE
jgi:uncharacterized protein YceH (UPF0502 family)